MKLTANSGGGGNFENPEPGTYPAVCVRIIDMGTQESEWQGEKKSAHKLKIVWELSETMSDGRPFLAMRDFTVSLHEKSGLRKFLSGWRGRDFNEDELRGFDPAKLVNAGCLLALVQSDKGYINVASASKLPKGMEAPKPVGDCFLFSLSEFDQAKFNKLSPKIQDRIRLSPEFARIGTDAFAEIDDGEAF